MNRPFKPRLSGSRRWRQPALCVFFACLLAAAATAAGEPSGVAPVSGQMPTALIELDGTASETYDGGQLTYRWTQIDGPRVELSDPSAAKPYFRTGVPGLYRFQLVVNANGLDSEPFVVEVAIERDNLPPVARVDPEIFGEVGKMLVIDGGASFDPEGEPLIYRWRVLSGGALEMPPDELAKSVVSFIPWRDGVFELELAVSDGKDVGPPAVVRLYIKPKPVPPVARARAIAREIPMAPSPEPQNAMVPPAGGAGPTARIQGPAASVMGEKVMLDARGSSGAASTRLKYYWRQKSGPFINDYEVVFDGAAQRFSPPRAGDYEFELRVSDGRFESEPAIHSLKVTNESEPPVAVVEAPARAMPGALVKLDATRSFDLEGSKLTFHWRQTGGPKVTRYLVDEALGDAAPAFHPPGDGLYSFELVVSSERGLRSKPIEIDIEVGAARRSLAVAVVGPGVMRTGERFVLEAVVGDGAAGDGLDYVWRQTDGPGKVFDRVSGRSLGLVVALPGRYVFDVAVLDREGVRGTARQTVEIFGAPGSGRTRPPDSVADAARQNAVAPPHLPQTTALEPLAPLATAAPAQPVRSLEPLSSIPAAAPPRPPVPARDPLPPMPTLEPIATASPDPGRLSQAATRPPVVENALRRPAAQIHPATLGNSPILIPPDPSLTPPLLVDF